ncbi:MAG TPA: hypothetical protein PKW23_04650 [Dictyoglomaceae bacterium]|nr:hypothetical protein [Dictyoglomaceae bacterium]
MKKFLILTVFSCLILFSLIYAQTTPPNTSFKLIGLSISEYIDQDEYGLTIIDGIFSIINFEEIPNTDSFPVYSRWIGNGTHNIEINLLTPEKDKVLAQLTDTLDLTKENEVIYTFDYFEDAPFEKTGIYWVQAKADGQIEKEIPLFVTEADSDIPILESLDKTPILLFSVPSLYVYENDNGLTTVSGVFEYYQTRELPFTDTFTIATSWLSGNGNFTQHVEILSPDGNTLVSTEPQLLTAEYASVTVLTDYIQNLSFEKAGDYFVKIYLDDKEVGNFVIKVVKTE